MSRNGSGTYSLPTGNPVVTNTVISSTWANNTLNDIASALTGSLASDGQTPATGNLNLGNNKILNLDDGTSATDAINLGQATTLLGSISGRIVQAVSSSFTAGYSTNNTSPTATGFTLSITPTSASSKILVLYSGPFANPYGAGGVPSNNAWLSMYRGSTNLAGGTNYMANLLTDDSNIYSSCAVNYLDNPSTTSAVTYQPYIWSQGNGALVYGFCYMTLLEIL
jgi:hypothetical protein